jgi:hypothetical protein
MRRFVMLALLACCVLTAQNNPFGLPNHNRPMVDAHNCYPEDGKWKDRLDRALKTGYPVGIEQDLAWGLDKATGKGRPVVSHSTQTTGDEPTLREHFFVHVRPVVEKALRENNRASWPLIILHFDFKDNQPALHQAVWELLGEYESWISTAPVTSDPNVLAPLDVKPLLVMTEDNDAQEEVFFKSLKAGDRLRLFGSAHTVPVGGPSREERARLAVETAPDKLLAERPTNYRRWWNSSWAAVEEGGQVVAGDWSAADERRLRALVDHAHNLGFWIRFYTLDGYAPADGRGWTGSYNFGSREAVLRRWQAAVNAGVNLIASDQYEELGAFIKGNAAK